MIAVFWFYQTLLLILAVPAAIFWCARALFSARYRDGWRERLGLWPEVPAGGIWVHGASVGEIRAVLPLLKTLLGMGAQLLVTATTSAGRAEAAAVVGEKGFARMLPIDFIPCLAMVFSKARPVALVIAETELWPGLLWLAKRKRIPVFLVTARISTRSFPRYMRFRPFVAWMLGFLDGIQAQTQADAERFLLLGACAEKVAVGGNMKFDLDPPDPSDPVACSLRRTRAGGWRVLVAGSVHPGEARTVFEGAERVRRRGVHLGVVVAPRHLERLPEIEKNLAEAGGSAVRYSALESPLEASFLRAFKEGKTILVDRYGLLGRLYGGAELAFVGGSLVPVGGHNLLEPLRWGVPVLFGPHMESASEVRNAVVTRKLGREVREAESVSRILEEYLGDEAAMLKVHSDSEAFFAANHGATRRVLDSLRSVGALDRQRQA